MDEVLSRVMPVADFALDLQNLLLRDASKVGIYEL